MNYIRGLHLDRRTLLRGLGGVALALPLLDAMTPAAASAQTKALTAPPRRLGFIMFPHGHIKGQWTPEQTGSGYTLSTALKAIEPSRKKITVLSGLACDPSKTRQGFHDRAVASFLTGVEKSKAELRVGPSVDQVAARTLGKGTAFSSLELAGEPNSQLGNMVFKTATQPLPVETNPRMLFERLFGDADRVDSAALLVMRARQQSMLDLLAADIGNVRRNIGAADKLKLTEYLDSVRDIEHRLTFTEQLAREGVRYERPAGTPTSYSEHIKMMFDLQTIALQTDMTRVFTFMMNAEGSNMTFPEIGWDYSHHMTSHHMGDPEKMAAITKINIYQSGLFNYLLTKMDAIQEQEGTLLDNTLMMYGSDLGDAQNHMQVDLPVLLAGGGSMGIKHDRHLALKQDTPITNLYRTMLAKANAPIDKFGDSDGEVSDV